MKKQFVTYEIALKLKELGFDEPCIAYYFNRYGEVELFSEFVLDHSKTVFYQHSEYETIATLWQQVIDWFREKYKINCIVGYTADDTEEFMAVIDRPNQDIDYNMNSTESYYEAREQAILKAIELCQKE